MEALGVVVPLILTSRARTVLLVQARAAIARSFKWKNSEVTFHT